MTIKELRAITGLSQRAFGEKYHIPTRTVENWESGSRKPNDTVLYLLERAVREDYEMITWYNLIPMNIDDVAKGLDDSYDGATFDYTVEMTTSDKKELIDKIENIANKDDYSIEIFRGDEDGEFIEGSDYDTIDNFLRWNR